MPRTTFAIIWSVLALAQLLYVVLPIETSPQDPAFLSTLGVALGAVAFGLALAILALLRIRALRPLAAGDLDLRTREGMGQLFTTLILCWILAESIAIFGLVLRFMGAERDVWSSFAIVGGLLLLFARPWQRGLRSPPLQPRG